MSDLHFPLHSHNVKFDTGIKYADPGVYYHFTSLPAFWSILEHESFWATQATFSNDTEELIKGRSIITQILSNVIQYAASCLSCNIPEMERVKQYCGAVSLSESEETRIKAALDNLNLVSQKQKEAYLKQLVQMLDIWQSRRLDCYIICVCKINDILSQWRGYCRNDGVSLGLAFERETPKMFVRSKDDAGEAAEANGIKLCAVWYCGDDTDQDKGELENVKNVILNYLTDKVLPETDFSPIAVLNFLSSISPYIKHVGFREEEECRMVFLKDDASRANVQLNADHVQYAVEKDNVQSPHLVVAFNPKDRSGKAAKVKKAAAASAATTGASGTTAAPASGTESLSKPQYIRFFPGESASEANTESFSNKLKEVLKGTHLSLNLMKSPVIKEKQIIIGPGDEVEQQKLFKLLDEAFNETADIDSRNVPIWCEGHLPIRTITVSPCQNQDEVVRSIRHYIDSQFFWMKYVKVSGSKIPFRRPK